MTYMLCAALSSKTFKACYAVANAVKARKDAEAIDRAIDKGEWIPVDDSPCRAPYLAGPVIEESPKDRKRRADRERLQEKRRRARVAILVARSLAAVKVVR